MKKKIIKINGMAMLLLLITFAAQAQKSTKKLSFGFGLELAVPTGDVKELYSVAPGITLRGSYKAGPGFVTLTTGALAFLPKSLDGADLKAGLQIPVKAGYKYIFKEHFFAMGEVGYSSFRSYFEGFNGEVQSVSNGGLTFAPTIGFQAGAFEIGLRYETTSFSGSNLNTGALRIGFNF